MQENKYAMMDVMKMVMMISNCGGGDDASVGDGDGEMGMKMMVRTITSCRLMQVK